MIVLLILFLKKTCLHAYKFFFTACAHKHTKSLNFKDKQIYYLNKGHLHCYFKLHHQKPTATYLHLLTISQIAEFSVVFRNSDWLF